MSSLYPLINSLYPFQDACYLSHRIDAKSNKAARVLETSIGNQKYLSSILHIKYQFRYDGVNKKMSFKN
jgi:hypothetical protein